MSELFDLKHTRRKLKNGGHVIVLDTGAVINAEAEAMLQALHSRSTGGLEAHLKTLQEKGAANFMANFYVGYGHASIGDCGTTTAFIEGVSMLVAKAIQDSALYSGQEASTRYIDFSKQSFIDPTQSLEGRDLLEMQRVFYLRAQEPTRMMLRELHPRPADENEARYDKAINARTFDITRGLLPAGASTNLTWHTNLRQAADRILFLRHHPLAEVREVAESLLDALQEHHPNSFGQKRYEQTEAYQDAIAGAYYFHDPDTPTTPHVDFSKVNRAELERARKLFEIRPPKTELPKYVAQVGEVDARFLLDFGSFRDVHRHRAITQRMPLLTTDIGFNTWYVENLAPSVRGALLGHIEEVKRRIDALGVSPEEAQYFTPMGYNTSNRFTGDLPATLYMVELRDSTTVHPTLQRVAHSIGEQIRDELDIPVYLNNEQGRFDMKRGDHDIALKR